MLMSWNRRVIILDDAVKKLRIYGNFAAVKYYHCCTGTIDHGTGIVQLLASGGHAKQQTYKNT